jgi:hypothetical protein
MNLFKSNKGEHKSHGHSPMKHMLHMIVCCGLPIIIIFALPFVARYSVGAASILGFIAPFICPVMMGGMLLMMLGRKKTSCCDETKAENNSEAPTK